MVFLSICAILLFKFGGTKIRDWFKPKNVPPTTVWFKLQKFVHILIVFAANAGAIYTVYKYSNLKIVVGIVIAFKSKDILSALMLTVYYIGRFFAHIVTGGLPDNTQQHTGNIVAVVPVYNEDYMCMAETVDSIINNDVENLKYMVCLIADGKKKVEELMTLLDEGSVSVEHTLTSWNSITYSVQIVFGFRKNVPCLLIAKDKNIGKRDSIILAFDLFNHLRDNASESTMVLRSNVRALMVEKYNISNVDYMFFTDADTRVGKKSLNYLVEDIEKRNSVASCGLVAVEFKDVNKNSFWRIYQNFQYIYGQFVRRAAENLFGSVTCLPGCITMIKVDEVAKVVIEQYGTMPSPNNMYHSMVQNIGTDRRLSSLFLFSGKRITFQSRAITFTKPPTSLDGFLRQRRRWAGNMYFNTIFNVLARKTHPVIRLFSFLDISKQSLIYFRLFNVCLFMYKLVTHIKWDTFLIQVAVVIWPTVFFVVFSMTVRFVRKQAFRMVLGYIMNKILAGIFSVTIFSTMIYNIGTFAWSNPPVVSSTASETGSLPV